MKDLLRPFEEEWTKPAFSRLRYLARVATQEEIVAFFRNLLVKATEAKETGQWEPLSQFLESWEDRLVARFAETMSLPQAHEVPWRPLTKPLHQACIALLTTGGVFLEGQPSWDAAQDLLYHEIPRDTPQTHIRVFHRHYDVSGPLTDVNCIFPLHRFRDLEREGLVGGLAATNYSLNPSMRDSEHLQSIAVVLAPQLMEAGVDGVFITPG